jgi:hypothetical protein
MLLGAYPLALSTSESFESKAQASGFNSTLDNSFFLNS